MANLVGVSSIGSYTVNASANGQSGTRIVHDDFVASTTGTATALYLYARLNNQPNVKLCIYSSAGALLGSTGPILIAEGWNTAALGASVSIVSGTTYKLGWYADAGYTDYYTTDAAGVYQDTGSGSYTTPASSITSTADSGIRNFAMYADGTAGTSITPGVGALTLAGIAATVAMTGDVIRTPTVGSLALTGNAPTVSVTGSVAITPSAGSLTLTGATVTQTLTVPSPSAAALVLTGAAPTVSQTTGATITPSVGSLTLTGVAPTVARTQNVEITPTVGALSFTGIAPVVSTGSVQITVPVGSLTFSGNVPTLIFSSPTIVPGTGSLTITGTTAAVVGGDGAQHRPRLGGIMIFG